MEEKAYALARRGAESPSVLAIVARQRVIANGDFDTASSPEANSAPSSLADSLWRGCGSKIPCPVDAGVGAGMEANVSV